MIHGLIVGVVLGYGFGALTYAPLRFLWAERWERRVRVRKRQLRRNLEIERELGIGDSALVQSVFEKEGSNGSSRPG